MGASGIGISNLKGMAVGACNGITCAKVENHITRIAILGIHNDCIAGRISAIAIGHRVYLFSSAFNSRAGNIYNTGFNIKPCITGNCCTINIPNAITRSIGTNTATINDCAIANINYRTIVRMSYLSINICSAYRIYFTIKINFYAICYLLNFRLVRSHKKAIDAFKGYSVIYGQDRVLACSRIIRTFNANTCIIVVCILYAPGSGNNQITLF